MVEYAGRNYGGLDVLQQRERESNVFDMFSEKRVFSAHA